jgi:hypothetical protein
MPSPRFTKENASAYGKAGAIARWTRKPDPIPPEPIPVPMADPTADLLLASALSHACDETLALARKSRIPQERAQLARALRDLRETWHLVTGKPKPANAKAEPNKPRRELPRIVSPIVSKESTG